MEETKVYHIYAKDRCLYHCVDEEEFQSVWKDINRLVGIMKTDYEVDDLSYEEVTVHKGDESSY